MTLPVNASPPLPAASIAELQTEARRRVVARAMRLGLWAWPSFVLLDAWMCFVAYPGAPFGLFVVYRIVVALALYTVYRAADERSDIYALGVTLYFLLTGRVSLRGEWPADARPVPPALEALLRRCMAARPDERVQSTRDLRLALSQLHETASWTRADAAASWRSAGLGGPG